MTTSNSYLSLQGNIICLLLALIGSMAIIEHPAWFGGVPQARGQISDQTSHQLWDISVPAE
jgi:hypothetical protein